jgi:hypothetical protein
VGQASRGGVRQHDQLVARASAHRHRQVKPPRQLLGLRPGLRQPRILLKGCRPDLDQGKS